MASLLLASIGCSTLIPDDCPRPDGGAVELVLQQGLAGYGGTTDATIQRWNPGVNVGLHDNLQVHLNAASSLTWHSRVVIRFELSGAVPSPRSVASARLMLHDFRHNAFAGTKEALVAHELRVRPVEQQVTDVNAAAGRPWAAPLGKAGADYDQAIVASAPKPTPLPPGGTWIGLDVTASVRRWIATPAANHGWMIRGRSDDKGTKVSNDVHFNSAQHTDSVHRPKLVLRLAP